MHSRYFRSLLLVIPLLLMCATSSAATAQTQTDQTTTDYLSGTNFREAERGSGGAIATESPAASRVGLDVLNDGGNAIDAAVATTFALNVARPQSCGIGGGGFMVYRGADGEAAALDFRETAPAAITADAFTGDGLYTIFTGHKTIGVPGTVAGMDAALERYGTMSLAETVAPAESLARNGVEVQPVVAEEMAANVERLALFPEAAEQFLKNGEPYEAGDAIVQTDLADTFALLASGGPEAFYEGEIAEEIVADMEQAGDYPGDEGLMTLDDLAGYEAKWREPLIGEYRGAEIIAMPPPTSGGVATLQMLEILEGYDLAGQGRYSAERLHQIAEAQKIAFADREEYLADPDFVDVPVEGLTSEDYAGERRFDISMDEAGEYEPGGFGGSGASGEDTNPDTNTTHLSVVDAEENAVALTCTIEQSFGSAVVAPGTGFLLNNELTDFSEPGTANELEPGKRPRSSINPLIVVRDDQPTLVTGAAGGVTIIMGAFQAALNHLDFGLDPAEAVDAARLDEAEPSEMSLEDARVSPVEQSELIAKGHTVTREGEYADLPRVQAVGIDPETGEALATTDPRSGSDEYAARVQTGFVESVPDTGGPSPLTVLGASITACGAVSMLLLSRRLARR
ncbi:MAG: gamma-glutamyltransferase [Rubrobacter sp.]